MSPEHSTLQKILLAEVERQARILLTPTFESIVDVWTLQLDILKFQIHVQEIIAARRRSKQAVGERVRAVVATSNSGWKNEATTLQTELDTHDQIIAIYQVAFRFSKMLGDAFAHIMFKDGEQAIHPLSENSRLPGLPTNHGMDGVIAMAEIVLNSGAGFPVIHDITNILRIGDLSVITASETPLTVELKTRLMGIENGAKRLTISMAGVFEKERWDEFNAKILARYPRDVSLGRVGSDAKQTVHRNSQIDRQLDRMLKAKDQQTARPGIVITTGNIKQATIKFGEDAVKHHWDTLQLIIDEAKETGYASRIVDGAMLYVAIHSEDSIEVLSSDMIGDLPSDLVASGILFADSTQNAIIVTGTAHHITGDAPVTCTPLFLYSIGLEDRMDILQGRLMLFTFINPGKVAAALSEAGFDARLPKKASDIPLRWMDVWHEIVLADGSRWKADLQPMRRYYSRLSFDYYTLDSFVLMAKEIAGTMSEVFAADYYEALARRDSEEKTA